MYVSATENLDYMYRGSSTIIVPLMDTFYWDYFVSLRFVVLKLLNGNFHWRETYLHLKTADLQT